MRPKFIAGLVVVVLLASTAALLMNSHQNDERGATVASPKEVLPAVSTQIETMPARASDPITPVPVHGLTREEIDAELDHLYQWSMSDDPTALSNILVDIVSPNREIADAAIDAAREFHSTNAIPYLKAAAMSTEDVEQQIALLEAVQFLSIPSMGRNGPVVPVTAETIEAGRQKQAARQERLKAMNQPAQSGPGAASQAEPDR